MFEVVKKRSTMNKLIIRIAALCSVVSGSIIHATAEFRSPLILRRGEMHFRLPEPLEEKTWWYDAVTADVEGCKERCSIVDFWAGAYSRWADRSFFKDEIDCEGELSNGTTRKTTSLSQLWFGQESFKGVDAFPGDTPSTELLATNPVLNFARISPDFTYSEQGIFWGMYTRHDFGCEDKWHVGTRVSIPFKVIEVQQRGCKLEEDLSDVCVRRTMNLDADADPNQVDYAYRLDFLTSLLRAVQINGTNDPDSLVKYGNGIPGNANRNTNIADPVVNASSPNVILNQPPVYAIRRDDGTQPSLPFRKAPGQVTGSIAADGSGGVDDSVLFFKNEVDYADGLGKDNVAQTDLWIVPKREVAADRLVPFAVNIGNTIQELIDDNQGLLSDSAVETLRRICDIDLCADRRVEGLGDLFTELYFGYGHPDEKFLDFLVGVRWPTGKKMDNAGDVFFQSTGHWRHFELELGMEGGLKFNDWSAFEVNWTYNHAFERTQKKAAPFVGATVRNIGPEIDAKVKWDYFMLRTDLNFFHPCNPELGMLFGYELWAKRHDRVHLACPEYDCGGGYATDCLGQRAELDFNILEQGTDSMTHKLRGEIFHRVSFWEVTAGASRVVAGRHAMQETEIHLALRLYF